MRYSDTHKQETRQKVVKAAARSVRAKGPEGVSVAEVMAEAGLTHGGFYAHFPNKEALIFAVLGLQTLLGRPNALASVTGAKMDVCGGSIHLPAGGWQKSLL